MLYGVRPVNDESLEVDGFRMGGHRSLLEGLSQRWVGVARPRNILARRTILQCKSALSNHLASIGSDDVDTQQAVRLGVGQHLDHTLSVEVGLGPGVSAEGEGTDPVRDLLVLEVLLALANPRNLRVGVHDRRDAAVVNVAVALLDVLDDGNGFFLSLVGKHGPERRIADATDVGDLGTVFGVDDDTATLVHLETNVLQAKASGVGSSSDGDEDGLGLELLIQCQPRKHTEPSLISPYSFGLATLGSIHIKLDLVAGGVATKNLGVELELDALLLQRLLRSLGDLSVHTRTADLAEELDDRDLGAQPRPDRSHLKTDDSTTNDEHGLGDLLEGDGASAGDDALLVNLETRERGGLGTGGDQEVLALDGGFAAVVERNLDFVLIDKRAGALDILGTVFLEEKLDALGQPIDSSVLRLHQVGQVKLDVADLDASVLSIVENLVVEVRVVEERF